MQCQRQKKALLGSRSKPQKADRFTTLLADIRSKIGDDWTFYEECIDGVLDTATNKQDTTAWVEQMQQLVKGNDEVSLSHEGLLFILRDMGVHLPRQKNRGEGERHFDSSPPLSPPKNSTEPYPPHIDDMTPLPVSCHGTMASLLPHGSLRPTTPLVTSTSRAPPTRLHQQQHQPQRQPINLLDLKQKVLPFDYHLSTSQLPSLTHPGDLKAFYYPPEVVILTEDYISPSQSPLRKGSRNPIFFDDPVFKRDVINLFSLKLNDESISEPDRYRRPDVMSTHTPPRQALPYDPNDDDDFVFRKRLQAGECGETGDNGVKPTISGASDTWPPWNVRFDLEL